MILKGNETLLQHFPKDYLAGDIDRSKCFLVTSSNTLFCKHYVGNVINHKFSHDDIPYRLMGKTLKSY